MLNDFVRQGAPLEVADARTVIPAIRRELDRAHIKGLPVLYLCDRHLPNDKEFKKYGWPVHAVQGNNGSEVIAELKPSVSDVIIAKGTYSGFFNTRLDEALKKLDVDAVRITGCVTHICVLFTAADAVLRDYAVTIVEDGVAGLAHEDHEAALRIMRNVLGVTIAQSGREILEKKAA